MISHNLRIYIGSAESNDDLVCKAINMIIFIHNWPLYSSTHMQILSRYKIRTTAINPQESDTKEVEG